MEESEEVVNYTFTGFSVSQSQIDMLGTRADENERVYSFLAVDVKDGNYVQSIDRIQLPASEALSDITLPLRVGSHSIYLLCSSKPWSKFDESSMLVNWDEQVASLGDVWSAKVTVNVQSGDAKTHEVQLKRVVAYVRTLIEDAIPSNLGSFRQTLVGGSWCFDLVHQCGDVAAQLSRVSNIPSDYYGNINVGIGIYTFLPSGATAATSYNLTAYDQLGNMMQTLTFNNVPLAVNRYTTYQGNYFGYDTGFTITLQEDWDAPNIIGF